MKTLIQLVVACLLVQIVFAQGTWTQKADFGGGARTAAVSFSIGNKGYLGTGLNNSHHSMNDFWEYNPAANTWTQKADFGGGERANAVGFNIGDKGYLGTGGFDAKDFWEYDPSANTWTRKADFGGSGRIEAAGFSIGSKGYLGTGYVNDSNIGERDFWEYDPASDTWTEKADVGGNWRFEAVGFSIGNKGYLGTGISNGGEAKDFWEYDPPSNTWIQKADFGGVARSNAVGFNIGSKGYIGCGLRNYNPTTYYKDFWEYDPATNTWIQKADFAGTARTDAVGFSIGGKGYIGTGSEHISTDYYKDFWEYTLVAITPVIKDVTDINSSQAYVHWNTFTNAVSYGVRRYRDGTSDYGDYLPVTDTFRKVNNMSANSLYVVQVKAYLNNGDSTDWSAPYSFTTTNTCAVPLKPRVSLITDSSARLGWSLPVLTATDFRIRYKESGATEWLVKSKKGTETKYILKGLKPSTLYNWQIRSLCNDDVTEWIIGPDFTTTSSFAVSEIDAAFNGGVTAKIDLLISPNPNKGNFTIQMQLPAKAASTTIILYNNFGQMLWQQNLGNISGVMQRTITLENKLSAGFYTLSIQRSDIKLNRKIIIDK